MLTTRSENSFIASSVWSPVKSDVGHAQIFPRGMLPKPVACLPLWVSTVTSTFIRNVLSTILPPNLRGALNETGSKEQTASRILTSVSFGMTLCSS